MEYTFPTGTNASIPVKGSYALRFITRNVSIANTPYPDSPIVVYHCPAGANSNETWFVYPDPNPTASGTSQTNRTLAQVRRLLNTKTSAATSAGEFSLSFLDCHPAPAIANAGGRGARRNGPNGHILLPRSRGGRSSARQVGGSSSGGSARSDSGVWSAVQKFAGLILVEVRDWVLAGTRSGRQDLELTQTIDPDAVHGFESIGF